MFTKIKTDKEIDNIRESGRMLATVLAAVKKQTEPGMTGKDADRLAAKELRSLGGKPAFKGYQGFPNVMCVSVNDEIVHGLPKNTSFKSSDLISYDFGVDYKGMMTDSAITFVLGRSNKQKDRLLNGTREALTTGIKAVGGKTPVGDISAAVQSALERYKLGIVRDLVGHGIGQEVHEEPNIPNFGTAGNGPVLEPGMTIAIEPMATLGDYKLSVDDDKWTIRTKDGSLSAHFEHTVLITKSGAEVLTQL